MITQVKKIQFGGEGTSASVWYLHQGVCVRVHARPHSQAPEDTCWSLSKLEREEERENKDKYFVDTLAHFT